MCSSPGWRGWRRDRGPARGAELALGGRLGRAAAEGVDPPHQAGLAVGRLVLVDDALGGGLVDALHRGLESLDRRVGTVLGGSHRGLDARLDLRARRLVPDAAPLVLPIAFDLALDVGHGAYRLAGSSFMSAPMIAIAPVDA